MVLTHFEYLEFIMYNIFQQSPHGQETRQERPEIYLNLQLYNLKFFRRKQFRMKRKSKKAYENREIKQFQGTIFK
jgi:hypothetical protein